MIVPAFSQGLYGRLRQLAAADWQRYVAHPFVQQLADGTLAENAFRRYLTQDYLFLIHFARSYALLRRWSSRPAPTPGRQPSPAACVSAPRWRAPCMRTAPSC